MGLAIDHYPTCAVCRESLLFNERSECADFLTDILVSSDWARELVTSTVFFHLVQNATLLHGSWPVRSTNYTTKHVGEIFDKLIISIIFIPISQSSWFRIEPALRNPVKRKSFEVIFARSLQGSPLTRGALGDKSATQKSCKGSASAACTIWRGAATSSSAVQQANTTITLHWAWLAWPLLQLPALVYKFMMATSILQKPTPEPSVVFTGKKPRKKPSVVFTRKKPRTIFEESGTTACSWLVVINYWTVLQSK